MNSTCTNGRSNLRNRCEFLLGRETENNGKGSKATVKMRILAHPRLLYVPLFLLNLLSIYPLFVAAHLLPPYHIKILLASPFQGLFDAMVTPMTFPSFFGWLLRTFIVAVLPFSVVLITINSVLASDDMILAFVYAMKRFIVRSPIITIGFYPILVFFRLIPPYDILKSPLVILMGLFSLFSLPIAIATIFTDLDDEYQTPYEDYGKQRSREKARERSER